MVRPCYRIERTPTTEESLPIGTSRFGGLPDAPAGFAWPALTGGKTPEAMEFVGQIRLQDLPNPVPERLPLQGLLSFFTRWSESRVFFYPEGTPLERVASPNPPVAPAPTGLFKSLLAELKRNPDPHHTYRPCALEFVPGLSLPDGGSALIEQLKLSPADARVLCRIRARVPRHATSDVRLLQSGAKRNGTGSVVFLRRKQEVRWHFPPDRFISATQDWILLLQVDTDDSKEGPGWMSGDAGTGGTSGSTAMTLSNSPSTKLSASSSATRATCDAVAVTKGPGQAVSTSAACCRPSSSTAVALSRYFCTLPVTVIGNSSTTCT